MKKHKKTHQKKTSVRNKKPILKNRVKKAKLEKVKKMGKQELKGYKKLLLRQKELITGEIQHIAKDTLNKSQKDASGDISGYTYHMADVATDTYDREFSFGIASSDREVLYDINEALKRVEDGTYGNCLECDKQISKKRLTAMPYTKFCIKCQKSLEVKGKSSE